jgi:outer membrane protein
MIRFPIFSLVAALMIPSQGMAQRSLTLEECRQLALQNSAKAKLSELEIEAAHHRRKAAITAYFPTISASGSIFKAQDPLMEITTSGGNLPVYDGNPMHIFTATQFAYLPSSTMGLLKSGTIGMVTAVQPIFAGGRILNGNKLASLGEEASGYKNSLARNEVLLRSEEQYWLIYSLSDKLSTIRAYEVLLDRLSNQVEDAYASGLTMKNDVLKVKLKKSGVLLNKTKLESGKKLATMAFCQYLGIPYDSLLTLLTPLDANEPPDVYYSEKTDAVEKRPEYLLLRAGVRSEELQRRMKLGEYLPQAGIGVAGVYMKLDDAKERKLGLVFGTLSIPISGWWEASHALGEQSAKVQIAENNLKDNTELLLLQIEKCWQDLNVPYKQVLLCAEAKNEAEENLTLNQNSYENGLTSVGDLLEARALLQQANDHLTDARAAYRNHLVEYLQATGR